MAGELGALKQAKIRTHWPNDAGDRTPWFAQEANVALLGEALGLELERT